MLKRRAATTGDGAPPAWPSLIHLEFLVGLSDGQHPVSVVDSAELAERAEQPLAAVAVPLHPLLLVLRAREDLEHQERT